MAHTPTSKNTFPCTDEKLLIAMGVYEELDFVHKFGSNEAVGTTYEDIWLAGGVHSHIVAATTLEVASSDANDTSAGTGARTVTIEGVDENWVECGETVTLTGQTPVVTTQQFLHVNRAYVASTGTEVSNQGDIYVANDSTTWTAGVPDDATTIEASIRALHGQTQQAIFHVPAGCTAYITTAYISGASNRNVTFQMVRLTEDFVERVLFEGVLQNHEFINSYGPYAPIPEKSVLWLRAKVDSGTALVAGGFDLILVDDQ